MNQGQRLPDAIAEFRDFARQLREAADFIDLACDDRIRLKDSLGLAGAVASLAMLEEHFHKAKGQVEGDLGMSISEAIAAAVTQEQLVAMRGADTVDLPRRPSTWSRLAAAASRWRSAFTKHS